HAALTEAKRQLACGQWHPAELTGAAAQDWEDAIFAALRNAYGPTVSDYLAPYYAPAVSDVERDRLLLQWLKQLALGNRRDLREKMFRQSTSEAAQSLLNTLIAQRPLLPRHPAVQTLLRYVTA